MPKLVKVKQYVLIAGGDARYMTAFFGVLKDKGFEIKHDDGRGRKSQLRKKLYIPEGVTLLVVVTNYGGHNVLNNYKSLAKNSGVTVIYCRLSVIELAKKLDNLCTKNGLMKVSSPA